MPKATPKLGRYNQTAWIQLESNILPENGRRAPKGNTYSNHPFLGDVLVSGRATLERSFTPEKRQLLTSHPNSSPKWRSLHPLKRSLTTPQGGHWEEPGGMFQGNLLSILNLNQLLGHFWGIRIPLPITTSFWGFPNPIGGKGRQSAPSSHLSYHPRSPRRSRALPRRHPKTWRRRAVLERRTGPWRTGQARRGGVGGDATEVEVGAWRVDAVFLGGLKYTS